ncbi:MAG: hypothetical protein U1E23_19125 [Reyranellaceae bacterium]
MAQRSPSIRREPPVSPVARLPWLAALLAGVLLVLALLIGSWLLRACAPVEPEIELSVREEPPPPAPEAAPDPTPVLKAALAAEQERQRALAAEQAALAAELRSKLALCKPPEPPPAPKPAPPVEAKPAPPPPTLPADRWARKDLGLLQGCWRLGHDTQGTMGVGGRMIQCAVRAGRICFGADGSGQREATSDCPGTGLIRCSAPITARFGDSGTLGTTQPPVQCQPAGTGWNGPPNSLTCRRVSDSLAVCRDKLGFEHEFRRE